MTITIPITTTVITTTTTLATTITAIITITPTIKKTSHNHCLPVCMHITSSIRTTKARRKCIDAR